MRVMVIVKSDDASEAGKMPDEKSIAAMMRFNEELVKAGVMKAGEGLHPTSKGARVHFARGRPTVKRGPFLHARDLVAGFWIWEVASLDEAIAWVKRSPSPSGDGGGEIEIRPILEAEDFGKELTPELRAEEEKLRAQLEAQQAAHHH